VIVPSVPLLIALAFLAIQSVPLASGGSFGTGLCFEDVDDLCGLSSGDPETVFNAILTPLESQIAGLGFVIFWGGILAVIWFKTENIMILSFVGIIVNATIVGFSEEARGFGLLLLGVSNGLLIFQLVRQRISIFS
jgi:hypothetical protein